VCDTQRQTERDRETTCAACEAAVVYTSQCRQSTADAAVNVDSETLSPPQTLTLSLCHLWTASVITHKQHSRNHSTSPNQQGNDSQNIPSAPHSGIQCHRLRHTHPKTFS